MPVSRVEVLWSGWSGGPGHTFLSFFDARGNETATLADVRNVFARLMGGAGAPVRLPNVINLDVSPVVNTYDESTGELLAVTTGTKPATIDGTGTGAFAAAVGACITWRTGGVHGGHKIIGKTFLVPLVGSLFDIDGTINSPDLATLQTEATAAVTSLPGFCVWSRPKVGTPPNPGLGGAIFAVQAATVADKSAVLRSRRD